MRTDTRDPDWTEARPADEATSVADLLRVLRRRRSTIVLVVALITAATAAIAGQLDARYRAVASLVIEPYGNIIDPAQAGMAGVDRGALETHAEALQSPSIILEAMQSLELLDDPEFTIDDGLVAQLLDAGFVAYDWLYGMVPPNWSSRLGISTADAGDIIASVPLESAASEHEEVEDVSTDREFSALVFASHLDASYSDGSSVMRVSFSSLDPKRAAAVANRIAEIHIRNQLEAKQQSARRATAWLSKQLPIIQKDVLKAEQRIAGYRSRHPLLTSKDGSLAEAALYGVNRALVDARANLAEKKAKLEIIHTLQASGSSLHTLADVIESPLISALRREEAELAAKNAELATTLDLRHPARQAVHEEVAKLSLQIEDQIERIVRSLENEIAVATAQVQRLGGDMEAAKAQNAEDSEAAVHLLELEREATAKRALYENLLRRYEEIVGQEGILAPGVRILSAAEVPVGPHTPSPVMATAVGFTMSIVMACLLALLLEQSDKTLRSARQVERELGVGCLGLIPGIKRRRRRAIHDCLVKSPASAYAQSLRTLAVLITARQRGPAVVVVSSALPREGKSTLAAALAVSVAQTTGRRVALVDFDLWRPSLAEEFGLKPVAGVSDFLVDGDWRAFKDQECMLQSRHGIDILPAGLCPAEGLKHLTDRTAYLLFEDLRGRYDLVVVDSPPLLGVNDGRILAMLADNVLVAVRWGSTSRMAVLGALKSLRAVSATTLGVVLTRVDSRKQALYGEGDSLQYQREFQRYYVG